MTRFLTLTALLAPAALSLSACMGANVPSAPMTTASPPYPTEVLRALPAGVSLSAVKVSNGCYFIDQGAGPTPMNTTGPEGTKQICG